MNDERAATAAGDGTSSYLWAFDPWKKVSDNEADQAPKQTPADFIYKLTPLAKFVFVLRNPTDRLEERTRFTYIICYSRWTGLAFRPFAICHSGKENHAEITEIEPLQIGVNVVT